MVTEDKTYHAKNAIKIHVARDGFAVCERGESASNNAATAAKALHKLCELGSCVTTQKSENKYGATKSVKALRKNATDCKPESKASQLAGAMSSRDCVELRVLDVARLS